MKKEKENSDIDNFFAFVKEIFYQKQEFIFTINKIIIRRKNKRFLELNLNSNLDILFGSHGSGKSITINLVKWLFFGFTEDRRKRQTINNLLQSDIESIEIFFTINNSFNELKWNNEIGINKRILSSDNETKILELKIFQDIIISKLGYLENQSEIYKKSLRKMFTNLKKIIFIDAEITFSVDEKDLTNLIPFLNHNIMDLIIARLKKEVLNNYHIDYLNNSIEDDITLNKIINRNIEFKDFIKKTGEEQDYFKETQLKKFYSKVKAELNNLDFYKTKSNIDISSYYSTLSAGERFLYNFVIYLVLCQEQLIKLPIFVDGALEYLDKNNRKKLLNLLSSRNNQVVILTSSIFDEFKPDETINLYTREFINYESILLDFLNEIGYDVSKSKKMAIGSQSIYFDYIVESNQNVFFAIELKENLESVGEIQKEIAKNYLEKSKIKVFIFIYNYKKSIAIYKRSSHKKKELEILELSEYEDVDILASKIASFLEGV